MEEKNHSQTFRAEVLKGVKDPVWIQWTIISQIQ